MRRSPPELEPGIMHEADGGRAPDLKMRANCNLDKFRPDIIACTITSHHPFVHVTHIHPAQNIREWHARFAEPNERRKIRDLIRGRQKRRTRNLAKIGGEAHFSKSHIGSGIGIWAALPLTPPLSEIFSAHIFRVGPLLGRSTSVRLSFFVG